jgi:hypothetical protein
MFSLQSGVPMLLGVDWFDETIVTSNLALMRLPREEPPVSGSTNWVFRTEFEGLRAGE